MDNEIGYVPDGTTAGGESLSDKDKEEITKEMKEEFKEE